MSTIEEVKQKVGSMVTERGLSFNSLSLQLGKNASYLQKFVKERSPKRLEEGFRKELANLLGVDEQELTDIPLNAPATVTGGKFSILKDLFFTSDNKGVSIDILDVSACCGIGAEINQENIIGAWTMPMVEFKTITTTSQANNVKMIRARGDSMTPTIKDGDWVLVDISNQSPDSDGLYLIRMSTGLAIKRIQGSVTDTVSIVSDNPKYPTLTAKTGEIRVLGKIIYTLSAEKVG